MKNIEIKPGRLSGHVTVPASKSICHRAVICAGLSGGTSLIENMIYSEDIAATMAAMEKLGAHIVRNNRTLEITGMKKQPAKAIEIDCNESGSTLRFMIPIMAVLSDYAVFRGKGKLVERPLQPFYTLFETQKIQYTNDDGKLPLKIAGKLKPGDYRIEGNVSSQFISGLLFALPLLDGDSRIIVTTELESKPYIDLTIDALKAFSVEIENQNDKAFMIKGNQRYHEAEYRIEGDYSQAAFWLVAEALGCNIACDGLNENSRQGDKAIIDIIHDIRERLFTEETVIDASQCPDLVPVAAVLGALSPGATEIVNAGRLRIKESDRLSAICCELRKIGADIEEKKDGLVITGKTHLAGGVVDSWNDHRIAMALAIASIGCRSPIVIQGADCVKKSYPEFWDDFKKLGGCIDEWHMGK